MPPDQSPAPSRFLINTYLKHLATATIGRNIEIKYETGSTNADMAGRLDESLLEQLLILTEQQTAGRGRFGREWITKPYKNLTFSFAWPVPASLKNPGQITLCAGLALVEAIFAVTGLAPKLKYPNDMLFGTRKAAGILTELKRRHDRSWAIIGVGINVNVPEDALDPSLREQATSLLIEGGGLFVSREELLSSFLNRIETLLDELASRGATHIIDQFRNYCAVTGERVCINGAGPMVEGVVKKITDDGGLLIVLDSGKQTTYHSGEVTFAGVENRG